MLDESPEYCYNRDRYKRLKEAVESFVIAHATCTHEDEQAAYVAMLKAAGLEKYYL